jgi:hypothetical protein
MITFKNQINFLNTILKTIKGDDNKIKTTVVNNQIYILFELYLKN